MYVIVDIRSFLNLCQEEKKSARLCWPISLIQNYHFEFKSEFDIEFETEFEFKFEISFKLKVEFEFEVKSGLSRWMT